MRFLLIFTKKSVPQWNNCYYDYGNMKKLIILCKKSYAIRCNIEDLARQDNYVSDQDNNLVVNSQALEQVKSVKFLKIQQIIERANLMFYKYHSVNKRVVYLFFEFKIHQLNDKLDKYILWYDHIEEEKNSLLDLLSNCYAQTNKLTTMAQLHIEAYDKIHKKHEKAFKSFGMSSPGKRTARLTRALLDLDRYRDKLNNTLKQHPQITKKYNKFHLEQQIESSPFKVSMLSYFFGLCNGFSICVFITAIVLLGANLSPSRPEDPILVGKQITFVNQYRLWKSLGFIVLYMWVFAISFYIFQKTRINYSLIFGYKFKEKKRSIMRLGGATFMLILWCCFFIFYVMDLIGIYQVAYVSENPSYPITIFFPIILFGIFVMFAIIEFIFVRRGTIFFMLTLARVISTLFCITQITFGVVWATEQFVSLVQLFSDLIYSFCYYSRVLQTPSTLNNQCIGLILIPECLTIFIYSIRLIQLFILAHKNGKFFGTREMHRSIRALIFITLAGLSIGSSKQNYTILWFWGFLAVIGAIYSFFIDVLLDWNLFIMDGSSKIRRPENIFPIKAINGMVAFNIIARLTYVLTFSPKIIYTYVTHPEVILTVAGVIQLGRRLVWNLLRVQNEQIKNNYFLQVRTDYEQKEKRVQKQLKKQNKAQIYKKQRLKVERSTKQLENLRFFINLKNQMKEKVIAFENETDMLLQQIEDTAQSQIFSIVGATN